MATIFTATILPTLTYANTFVDWFTTTNTIVVDFNNFTANAYAKNAGTLYLNESTTALVVGNGVAQFGNQVQITGTGSYLTVDNNIVMNYGQLVVSNANSSIIASGVVQVGNTVYANGANTGLFVANNTTLNSNAYITGNAYFGKQIFVTGPVTLNALSVQGATSIQNTLSISGTTTISNTLTATGNVNALWFNATNGLTGTLANISGYANSGRLATTLTGQIGTQLYVGDSIYTTNSTFANINYSNTVVANTSVTSNVITANTIQGNLNVNTATLTASVGNIVSLNATTITTGSLYITTGSLYSNNITSYQNLNANNEYANVIVANTSILTPALNVSTSLTANTANAYFSNVFATNLTLSNNLVFSNAVTITTGSLYSNNITSYQNLNANNEYANVIVANTSILTPALNVSVTLTANNANAYFSNVFATNLTLSGNLAISYPIVSTSNSFTLNANNTTATPFAQFVINRGTGSNTAQIQWYESGKQWQINDVTTNQFYSILTSEVANNSLVLNSTSNIATSQAVYTANLFAQAAFNVANAAYTSATNVAPQIQPSFNQANSASNIANSAFAEANIVYTLANTISNTTNSAYARANTSANLFTVNGTTASPINGGISFASLYGESINASGNTITIGTSQDLRSSASPTFNTLTLTGNLAVGQGGTGSTTAAGAVQNLLPSNTNQIGFFLQTTGPGNFGWISNTANNLAYIVPTGVAATNNNVQLALNDLYFNKANLASPQFTGTPNSVTQATTTQNTTIATTGFVGSLANSGYYFSHNITGTAQYANNLYQTTYSSAGSVPYQSAQGTTAFTAAGATSQVLIGGTSPSWFNMSSMTVGAATLANATSNIAGGGAGQIPYNTAYGATSFISAGTAGQVLVSAGTGTPVWSSSVTASGSGIFATLTANTSTNAANLTASFITSTGAYYGTSISVTGNITAYSGSDRKWKENIRDIQGALDIVDAVGGKLFDWTDEYIAQNGGPNPYSMQKADFGVVAQDLQGAFPVATRVRQDGSLAVDYEKLCAVAFAAIKELRAEVEALKQSK